MPDERDTAEIIQEIRRQGRAAVAAQAAAEACLAALAERTVADGRDDRERALVRALLPLADALDRVATRARELSATSRAPSRLARWLGAGGPSRELDSLAHAVGLLRVQLEDALLAAGVVTDGRTGVPVDGEAHRVVGTRPGAPDQVLEVVRPGYAHRDSRLREADVIAGVEGSKR